MATIGTDPNGHRRILFVASDAKRKTIRLGAVPKKLAESIKSRVEHLIAITTARMPMDADTAQWVGSIGDDLAAKLAAVGLIPPRAESLTMGRLLELYANEKESTNKPGTQTNHRTISNDLNGYFGEQVSINTITEERAGKFLEHLRDRGLASATIARRLRRVRSIFAFAVKKKCIPSNPFEELKSASTIPAERKAYVTVADAHKLIEAASSTNWRTIIALSRFGGLRCPSEVLTLKLENIDQAAGRMTVWPPRPSVYRERSTG